MVFSNNLLMGAGGQASGYEIDQSIRFNDNDSAYLNRTPGSAGDRRTFTFSCWVKRANITGANAPIFTAGGDDWLMFLSANTLGFNTDGTGNYRIVTSQLFRDPGAWFHLVLRVDTTNSTAGDRLRFYINGSEVTSFGTDTNPTLNLETAFNNTGEHDIGKLVGASQYFDGYLAEIHHVDGSSLAASSFGETNDDGVWVPKAYSGSYGTTGFYLKGQDSSALGDDTSGNGNDFSSSGLAAADQMSDSPTDNHCTLNPLWVDQHTLSDGNLVASAAADSAAIGTMAFDVTDSDGFYFEAKVTTAATYPNVGIRTVESPSQVGAVTSLSGNTTGRYSFTGSDGNFNDAGSGSSYGSAWAGTADKVIGVLVKAGALYFSIDGTIQNSGTAAKTGLTGYMLPTVFYDAGSGTTAAWEMRFDASDWGTTPTGYKAISTANLPDPAIADPSAHVQTTLYTGTGSSRSVDQSGNSTFQPDFVWVKSRGTAADHALYDAVRGVQEEIKSNDTAVEATVSTGLTAFESDGFQVGSRVGMNGSSDTFVAWQWLAGNSSGSTNEDGSVDSTVTANTTAGFSIVKWVHTTSANYTVGHGLGATPKMVIVKTLDQGTNWGVYHSDITTGNRLILNTNAAQGTGYWGANTWNSTVFSIGSVRDANSSNAIGYVFAEVEGFSKFGSYTGNGNADGPFVYTGFAPSLIIFKNASAAYNWDIRDNKRDPLNPNTFYLSPSLNGAEVTTSDGVDFLSNGFKYRSSGATANGSGNTIIYAAFAESPFGGSGAAPATAR